MFIFDIAHLHSFALACVGLPCVKHLASYKSLETKNLVLLLNACIVIKCAQHSFCLPTITERNLER